MELEYKIIKLKNSDTIISEINSTDEKTVSLHRPMIFKLVTVVDPMTSNTSDVLMMRNWADFSIENDITISTDLIAASWKPDAKILNCYEVEKFKQDMPEIYKQLKKEDETLPKQNPPQIPFPGFPPLPGMPNPFRQKVPPGMANFNLNLPIDVAKQLIEFLEQNGIELMGPEFDDDSIEEIDEDISENDSSSDVFGNNPDDWSPDPNDYIK
jgi:hypothetical protein